MFAPGSAAAIVPHAEGPIAFDTSRIEISEEEVERALEAYARAQGVRVKHFSTVPAPSPKKVHPICHAVSALYSPSRGGDLRDGYVRLLVSPFFPLGTVL